MKSGPVQPAFDDADRGIADREAPARADLALALMLAADDASGDVLVLLRDFVGDVRGVFERQPACIADIGRGVLDDFGRRRLATFLLRRLAPRLGLRLAGFGLLGRLFFALLLCDFAVDRHDPLGLLSEERALVPDENFEPVAPARHEHEQRAAVDVTSELRLDQA